MQTRSSARKSKQQNNNMQAAPTERCGQIVSAIGKIGTSGRADGVRPNAVGRAASAVGRGSEIHSYARSQAAAAVAAGRGNGVRLNVNDQAAAAVGRGNSVYTRAKNPAAVEHGNILRLNASDQAAAAAVRDNIVHPPIRNSGAVEIDSGVSNAIDQAAAAAGRGVHSHVRNPTAAESGNSIVHTNARDQRDNRVHPNARGQVAARRGNGVRPDANDQAAVAAGRDNGNRSIADNQPDYTTARHSELLHSMTNEEARIAVNAAAALLYGASAAARANAIYLNANGRAATAGRTDGIHTHANDRAAAAAAGVEPVADGRPRVTDQDLIDAAIAALQAQGVNVRPDLRNHITPAGLRAYGFYANFFGNNEAASESGDDFNPIHREQAIAAAAASNILRANGMLPNSSARAPLQPRAIQISDQDTQTNPVDSMSRALNQAATGQFTEHEMHLVRRVSQILREEINGLRQDFLRRFQDQQNAEFERVRAFVDPTYSNEQSPPQ